MAFYRTVFFIYWDTTTNIFIIGLHILIALYNVVNLNME